MTAKIRSRLTYANVIATLALFLVVAGGSVALGGAQSRQSAQVEQKLVHKLKVVKGLVKEVEAQQDTSDQQTLGKLDNVHNAVIDAHVQLGSKLDMTLARLKAVCFGQSVLSSDHETHDDRSRALAGFPISWSPCHQFRG